MGNFNDLKRKIVNLKLGKLKVKEIKENNKYLNLHINKLIKECFLFP
jgi:hypothetical protein